MSHGTIATIHRVPEHGGAPERVEHAQAQAGQGLDGDRYAAPDPEYTGWEFSTITLIEADAEADAGLTPGTSRRNIAVRGIALNDLVGKRFRVGDALCEGVELCHPCASLEKHLERPGLVKQLAGRGGIRAKVLEAGTLKVGDAVTPVA